MGVVHRQIAPANGATWDYATVGVKAYHEGGPLGFLCVIPAWAKANAATAGTPAASEATR